jgi:peptide methionine sulfoxide reductase msrA/msrB
VKTGTTGHAEAVRVIFDPAQVSYEELAKLFFEIHDPTQVDRQGVDHGTQYRSEIFYTSPAQRRTAEKLIATLVAKGYAVATRLTPAAEFYPAEDYHQKYFERTGGEPDSCRVYGKRRFVTEHMLNLKNR